MSLVLSGVGSRGGIVSFSTNRLLCQRIEMAECVFPATGSAGFIIHLSVHANFDWLGIHLFQKCHFIVPEAHQNFPELEVKSVRVIVLILMIKIREEKHTHGWRWGLKISAFLALCIKLTWYLNWFCPCKLWLQNLPILKWKIRGCNEQLSNCNWFEVDWND